MNVSVHWRCDRKRIGDSYYDAPDSKPMLDILVSDERGFRLFTIPYREATKSLYQRTIE